METRPLWYCCGLSSSSPTFSKSIFKISADYSYSTQICDPLQITSSTQRESTVRQFCLMSCLSSNTLMQICLTPSFSLKLTMPSLAVTKEPMLNRLQYYYLSPSFCSTKERTYKVEGLPSAVGFGLMKYFRKESVRTQKPDTPNFPPRISLNFYFFRPCEGYIRLQSFCWPVKMLMYLLSLVSSTSVLNSKSSRLSQCYSSYTDSMLPVFLSINPNNLSSDLKNSSSFFVKWMSISLPIAQSSLILSFLRGMRQAARVTILINKRKLPFIQYLIKLDLAIENDPLTCLPLTSFVVRTSLNSFSSFMQIGYALNTYFLHQFECIDAISQNEWQFVICILLLQFE